MKDRPVQLTAAPGTKVYNPANYYDVREMMAEIEKKKKAEMETNEEVKEDIKKEINDDPYQELKVEIEDEMY